MYFLEQQTDSSLIPLDGRWCRIRPPISRVELEEIKSFKKNCSVNLALACTALY